MCNLEQVKQPQAAGADEVQALACVIFVAAWTGYGRRYIGPQGQPVKEFG